MNNPEIVMKFKLGEPVEVSVNGVKGPACRAFSKPFEDLIGGRVVSSVPTAEAAQSVATVAPAAGVGTGSGVVGQ